MTRVCTEDDECRVHSPSARPGAPALTSAMVTIECIDSVLTQILSTIPQQHFWRDIHDNSSRQECHHV